MREQIALLSADNFADERKQKIEQNEKLLVEAESKLQFAKDNLPDKVVIVEEKDLFGETVATRKESSRDRKLRDLTAHVNTIKAEIKKLRDTAETGRNSTLALARQLTDWNPYDQNVSSPFFDANWMFGIKDGFDIVIGNPPYVIVASDDPLKARYETTFSVALGGGKKNLYHFFFEKALTNLVTGGVLSFITPDTFLAGKDTLKLRDYLLNNAQIKELTLYSEKDKVFKNVNQAVAVSIILNGLPFNDFSVVASGVRKNIEYTDVIEDEKKRFRWSNAAIKKIKKTKTKVSDFFDGNQGDVNLTSKKEFFRLEKDKNSLPLVRGIQISPYSFVSANEWCLTSALRKEEMSSRPRIVFQEVSNTSLIRRVKATVLKDVILGHSVNYIIPKTKNISLEAALGVINSKVINFYFKFYSQTNHVPIGDFKEIPFPEISIKTQNAIADIVVKILELKATDKESDISQLEAKIDEIVYRLYGLTYDEVLIVDPETPVSREEYENGD